MVSNFGISMEIVWFLRRGQFPFVSWPSNGEVICHLLKIVDEIQKETFARRLCFLRFGTFYIGNSKKWKGYSGWAHAENH